MDTKPTDHIVDANKMVRLPKPYSANYRERRQKARVMAAADELADRL